LLRASQRQVSLACAASGEVLLQSALFRFGKLACQGSVQGCFWVPFEIHADPLQPTISPASRRRK
jgi:hypothetical protein